MYAAANKKIAELEERLRHSILRSELDQLLASTKKESDDFLRMAQDSQQRLDASLQANERLMKQFNTDQATIQDLLMKNTELVRAAKEVQGTLGTRAKELESEVQNQNDQQKDLETEVASMRVSVGRANSAMTSKCSFLGIFLLWISSPTNWSSSCSFVPSP